MIESTEGVVAGLGDVVTDIQPVLVLDGYSSRMGTMGRSTSGKKLWRVRPEFGDAWYPMAARLRKGERFFFPCLDTAERVALAQERRDTAEQKAGRRVLRGLRSSFPRGFRRPRSMEELRELRRVLQAAERESSTGWCAVADQFEREILAIAAGLRPVPREEMTIKEP